MDPSPNSTRIEPRFTDSFLQERNIKWMLGVGTAILLGSSLMLVSSQWSGYSPALKQMIILGYTAMIYVVGRYGSAQLALRRTGSTLLSLAVMLVPVACAALPWLWEAQTWNLTYLGLLLASGTLAILVGRSAFRYIFHGPDGTLTASYVVLSLAGAIVPISDATRSPWMAALLWLVFAAGTIKVNRRIFWLIEERRQPRAFGFLPMLLLGAQFLALFCVYFVGQFTLGWIGLGCVLTAVPVLLAADSVAWVFQQRTGDLVRPLPWSILTPLVLGLLLCAVGICLAGSELFGDRAPFALVPTAALAAGLMGVVARRTNQRAFVWTMLVLLTVAYRFVPVFFAETVRLLIESTAAAIHQSRLPWAYYGFTFLPLLGTFTAAAYWAERRGNELFAAPARHFSLALALLFLGMAPTNAKALFPAGLTLAAVFAAQTAVFRNRAVALPAVAAWLLAALGFPAFFNGVVAVHFNCGMLPPAAWFTSELVAAAALLAASGKLDETLHQLPVWLGGNESDDLGCLNPLSICRGASLVATMLLMVAWTGLLPAGTFEYLGSQPPGLLAGCAVAALALVHALIAVNRSVSVAAVVFSNFVGLCAINGHYLWIHHFVSPGCVAVIALAAQWLLSYLLAARPEYRVSQAFEFASRVVSLYGLKVFLVLSLLIHATAIFVGGEFTVSDWVATGILLVWAVDGAQRGHSRQLGALALIGSFVVPASAAMALIGAPAWEWLPTMCTGIAVLHLAMMTCPRRRGDFWSAITAPAEVIVPGVLTVVACTSLYYFTTPMLVAGTLAPLALLAFCVERKYSVAAQLALAVLNWRLIGLVICWVTPEIRNLTQLADRAPSDLCLPIALVAAASVLLWAILAPSNSRKQSSFEIDLAGLQRLLLRSVTALLLIASLTHPALAALEIVFAVGALGMLVAAELLSGCRTQDEIRIWIAEGLVAVAIGYLAWFHVVEFGRGVAMYVVLGAGLLMSLLGHLSSRRPGLAVMAVPFRWTGLILPLVTVLMAVFRHVWLLEMQGIEPQWLGRNSLAILLAAAFYYWKGLETGLKYYQVLAAAILNVALALLWREMRWTDPQFFMIPIGISILWLVELLENEIPVEHHTPLRYAGALVILVSPTFHIVHGSWIHLFTLMVASVAVILVAIGLRIRALIYTGTAFLAADLLAMVVRGSVDRPQLLWVAGLALGASVIGLAAVCELRREQILQRVRAVGAVLEGWR